MNSNSFTEGNVNERNILTLLGYEYAVDDWIFRSVPCLLLYKDRLMDICPVQDYTNYELTMLQKDSGYKSAWIPIGYGSFVEMQKFSYEIGGQELGAICTNPLDMK